MKKLVFWSFCLIFAAAVAATSPLAPAFAQGFGASQGFGVAPSTAVPKITPAINVATTFYKWTRQLPPFNIWARHIPEAKTPRSEVAWQVFLRQKPAELEANYGLVMYNEPINVGFSAVLSKYSEKTGGYLVRNFADETFFSFDFAGRSYAVIPKALMDHQWLSVSPFISKQIEESMPNKSRRQVTLIITLEPIGAYKDPMEIDGKKRYVVATKVSNMGIYSCDKGMVNCKTLWHEGTKEAREQEKNELLNLKQ